MIFLKSKRLTILFLIFYFVLLSGCTNETNNNIVKTLESPDKMYSAVIFIRDMGATTDKSYQLSILPRDKNLGNSRGNIFISYGSFDIEWKSKNKLFVNKKESAKVFRQETKFADIKITYNY